MTFRFRRGGALLTAIAASVAMAGCAGGDGPSPRPGPQLAGFEEVTSTADRLPDAFPEDLPLPRFRRVLYSAVSNLGLSAYFETATSPAALREFLLDELPRAGWTLRSCHGLTPSPEAVTIITAGRDATTATVTVGYHPDYAARLDGRRYDFFVSLAFRSQAPDAEPAGTVCGR